MVVGSPIVLNLVPGGVMKMVHVNQADKNIDIQFQIMNGNQPYNIPEGWTGTIRGTKGDAFGYSAAVTVTAGSNVVTVHLKEQLTAVAGVGNIFELVFASTSAKVSTENFILAVERSALNDETVISESDLVYANQVLNQLQSVAAVNQQVQQNKSNIAAETAARQTADNTLQGNINAEASTRATADASLQSQIDQLVAPSGEAPSAAEVMNARIGADGVTYPTLGDAIRANDTELKSQINKLYTNQNGNVDGIEGDLLNLVKKTGTGTEVTTSQLFTGLENTNIAVDGSNLKFIENVTTDTYYMVINKPCNIYFSSGDPGYYVALCVGRFVKSIDETYVYCDNPVRYRSSDNNLPTNLNPVNLYAGDFIAVTIAKNKTVELFGLTYTLTIGGILEQRFDETDSQVKDFNLFVSGGNMLFEKDSSYHPHMYYNTAYSTTYQEDYDVFEVKVTSGITYYIKGKVRFISKAGTNIHNYSGGSINPSYTADFSGTLYITVYRTYNFGEWAVTTSNSFDNVGDYIDPYARSGLLQQGTGSMTHKAMSQKAVTDAIAAANSGSILKEKKWIACGDSFTHGDFDGIDDPTDYQFQDAPYQGENMVYPFFIGRRTGADVTNEAINGSTMAFISGRANCFSAANGRYTQIPADADYITLYFGINDSHQSVPIGTINDTTNETFYGAWNIVMEYLIRNHPNAKIGIIISNGCDTIDYPNAEIAIAKKWGVAYFDMNGDPRIPLVFRTNGKSDLCQTVIDIRKAQYVVSASNPTNWHPNVACHKDESTFIQAWLESI